MSDASMLALENSQVLGVVQAMLGLVSSNFRAVSIEVTPASVTLHFLLRTDSPLDREAIDDIAFELEALQGVAFAVDVVVHVSAAGDEVGRLPGRLVFSARED